MPDPIDLSGHDSMVGAVQRAQARLADDVVGRMSDAFKMPAVSEKVGKHQRQQTRVPTAETLDGTVVSMGRRLDDRNYDGWGLTTIAHVVIDAAGGKDKSTLTMQANGQTLLQSDQDSVYVVSKGPAVMASAAVANIVASGGLAFAAGSSFPIENVRVKDEKPTAPHALDNHADWAGSIADAFKGWTDGAATALQERDGLHGDADPDAALERKPAHVDMDAATTAKQTLSDRNELGKAEEASIGAVAVYGAGGLLLGTPRAATLHAENAITVSSKAPAVVGTESLDLSAGTDARLVAGRDALFVGGRHVRAVAHDGNLHLAARKGEKVEVQAKNVLLGQLAPPAPQTETELVKLRAKKEVSIATGRDPGAGPDGVHVETHGEIGAKADKTITLEGTQAVTFKVKDKDVEIVLDPGGKITVKAGQSVLEISKGGGLTFKKQGNHLTADSSKAFLGVSSANSFTANNSGVDIKGGTIKIG
jgi:hypothetical protein